MLCPHELKSVGEMKYILTSKPEVSNLEVDYSEVILGWQNPVGRL